MRLARTYEELRGRDIEGFVRFIRDQEALGAAQLEAVSEEEGADAVRLLTIHAAKGLEFKVVVVADAGRDIGGPPPADEILALSDGRFGFKVVHPTLGEPRAVFGYEEVRDAGREAGRAERLRLYYVAMTRAVDRLIVSGAIGEEPRHADRLGALAARVRAGAGRGRRAVRARARRRVVPRPGRPAAARRRPEASRLASTEEPEGQLSLFAELPATPPVRGWRAAGARPGPVAAAPPRPAALVLGARALRALLVPLLRRARRRAARAPRRGRPAASGSRRPRSATRCTGCSRLVDLREPRTPDRRAGARVVPGGDRGGARADRRLRRGVLRLGARAPDRRPRRRAPGAPVRLRARRRAAARPARRPPARRPRASSSTTRRTCSASARPTRSSRPTTGCSGSSTRSRASARAPRRSRSSTRSSSGPTRSSSTTFALRDVPALEAELSAAIARIDAGEFVPTPGEFTCSGCPALDLVCAGPRLRGGCGRRARGGRRGLAAQWASAYPCSPPKSTIVAGLVADRPRVVAGRRDGTHRPGPISTSEPSSPTTAIRPEQHVPDVQDLAAVGAGDRLDVVRPAPARLERPLADRPAVEVDEP